MQHERIRRSAAVIMSTAMFAMPAFALAQEATTTQSSVEARVKTLLAQIESLKQQVRQLVGTSTPMMWAHASGTPPIMGPGRNASSTSQGVPPRPMVGCPELKRDLALGLRGDDVKGMQDRLVAEGFLPDGSATGFFGERTAQAIKQFQKQNGIAGGSGFVGQMTRELFGKRCGAVEGRGMGPGVMGSTTPREREGMFERMKGAIGSTTLPMLWKRGTTTPEDARPRSQEDERPVGAGRGEGPRGPMMQWRERGDN